MPLQKVTGWGKGSPGRPALQEATREVFIQTGLEHQIKGFLNPGWLAALAGSKTLSRADFARESALFDRHRRYLKADDIQLELHIGADLQRKLTEAMDYVAECLAECTSLLHRAGETLFELARKQTKAANELRSQARNLEEGELFCYGTHVVWLRLI